MPEADAAHIGELPAFRGEVAEQAIAGGVGFLPALAGDPEPE